MTASRFSYTNFSNASYVESLYDAYMLDPTQIDPSWRQFFEGVEFASQGMSKRGEEIHNAGPELRVYHLIDAYRTYGHLMAQFNPVRVDPPAQIPELDIQRFGFTAADLNSAFPTCGFLKEKTAPLKTIIEALGKTYCAKIGIEYMGLGNPKIELWLQSRIEPFFDLPQTQQEKVEILQHLNRAELFESFLHTKYVGQKRFSLEGSETMIPMMVSMLDRGVEMGLNDVVLGMAHRGRLNVLANILGKSYGDIFYEFEDHFTPDEFEGTGDVKYHKGFISTRSTKSGKPLTLVLAANPSHLESVDPVVEGYARALQEHKNKKEVLPLLIHGDAAIAGQGVVYETMQLGQLNGYGTGGTIHLVINNQIGFTTLPKDARSTRYCTDLAKAFGAPVFHVNAEDPAGCVMVAKLTIELRQEFGCDVFIDLNGYRKYGHNESDEPTFTQPVEYHLIKEKKSIREIYRAALVSQNVLTEEESKNFEAEFKESLQKALSDINTVKKNSEEKSALKQDLFAPVTTGVDPNSLIKLAETFCTVPEGFHIHPKIARFLQERLAMVKGDPQKSTIDWGMAEHLAYASLLVSGYHVRISGQDCRRGTFSHRHAVWVDQNSAERYFPLSHLSGGQAKFDIFNSPLSEFAVLGFDFGYTLSYPQALVIWEAQFGDFANGAQVIIDQYIISSEQKWGHRSDITLMLPHGYEGQGPEHSSARIERFLQSCGDDNIQVVNCTTPAQLFHLLRRQTIRPIKKPLVIFTPKALLRHPQCVSSLNDLSTGSFQEILDDAGAITPKKLLFCSGKIYYDLIAEREKRKAFDRAIIRIEQLYPLNQERLNQIFNKYPQMQEYIWVQEEPSNMGAWDYIRHLLGKEVRYAGRKASAAPATGSHALHKKQLTALLEEAFS